MPSGWWESFQAYSIIDPADGPTVQDPTTVNGVPTNLAFRFRNFLLPCGAFQLGAEGVDGLGLFCAGQAWSPFGDLIVGGGTDFRVNQAPLPLFTGEIITFAFNPRAAVNNYLGSATFNLYPGFVGMWEQGPDLRRRRWYPSTTLTHRLQRTIDATHPRGRELMVVTGGSLDDDNSPTHNAPWNNPQWNTYEGLVINQEAIAGNAGYATDSVLVGTVPVSEWNGPGSGSPATATMAQVRVDWLYEYPRVHLLSTGLLMVSGYQPRWAVVDPENPGTWTRAAGQPAATSTYSSNWNVTRQDGASLLFPNLGGPQMNIIMRIGGSDEHWYLPLGGVPGSPKGTTASMETLQAGAIPPPTQPGTHGAGWVAGPPMPSTVSGIGGGRFLMNAVILPTGGILVIGGIHRAHNTASLAAGAY